MSCFRPRFFVASTALPVLLLCFALVSSAWAQSIDVAAKSWYLHDLSSGQELASSNPDERVEPASLTKLMTAYLAFAAIKQGKLALDQSLTVSERAWRAEGSRMFIEPRKPVTVDELLHGMIVQSGNDASIALAEAVSGSEENFARMMNREAQRLGLKNSSFQNATGLPGEKHYSTARDMAMLAGALIRDFPEYYPLYSIKEYRYNNINQLNRNRLLWSDPHVDGMKTGHTKAAGYCLVASAKRGERRLLSVVLGTRSETARASESQRLLNFGFQAFDSVKLYAGGEAVSQLKVFKGRQGKVKAGFPEDFLVSVPSGQDKQLKVELVSLQPLLAPVKEGQQIARLKLTLADKPFGEFPVLALEEVPVGGMFRRGWDTLKLWFE